MQSTWDCISSCSIWTNQGLMLRILFVDFNSTFNTIIPTLLQTKLIQLSVSSSICQWITSFLTDRQQLVRLGEIHVKQPLHQHWCPSGLCSLPHCSSPCTPTTAPLKTHLSSSWSLQMTPHLSASYRAVTSLLTDKRLSSWLSGAVLTTWSWTRSKQWRWSWTSGENPPALPPLTIMDSTVTTVEPFRFLSTIISQDLNWDTHIDSIAKKAQQRLYFLRQLRKFNLPQELLKHFYSAVIESVLCISITVWFGSAKKNQKSEDYRERFGLLKGLLVLPCPPFKNCTHPEWGKGLRKSLWIPHIQAIPFLNFCHLAGASEPQIPGQPGTRTVSSPRQSTLWTVKCSPQGSQAQEQFLPPGNLPYEQLNVPPIVQ